MEQLGPDTVRQIIAAGGWPANYRALAEEWLRNKDTESQQAERNELQVLLEQRLHASAKQAGAGESRRLAAAKLIRMEQLGPETVPEIISSGRWPADHRALAQVRLRNTDKEPQEGEHNEGQVLPELKPPSSAKQAGTAEGSRRTAAAGALATSGPRKIRLEFALWFASLLALFFVVIAAVCDIATRDAGSPIPVQTSTAMANGDRANIGR
jgi:hypothetical protein